MARLGYGGKREGMPARANHPSGKVRELRRRLLIAAKRSPKGRFHGLYDRIRRGDVLAGAWRLVRANGGAAGVDGETLGAIEQQGVGWFLEEIAGRPRRGTYRPRPVRRRHTPKADGKQRPLGIPAMGARVVQGAAEFVFERLRLTLPPDKTRLVEIGPAKAGFEFLGCHRRGVRAPFKKGRQYRFRRPSAKAMKRVRTRIRELTDRRRSAGVKDIREVIGEIDPVLRGRGGSFRTKNASAKLRRIDRYLERRLTRLRTRRGGNRPARLDPEAWTHVRFVRDHGLYRLLGTIRCLKGANAA